MQRTSGAGALALPISGTSVAVAPGRDLATLSAVVDACPTGVLIVEYDGRLVHANPAARDLLGLDANRLLVAYTSDYLQLVPRLRPLRGGQHPNGVTTVQRVVRPDGQSIWVELRLVALQAAGGERPLATVFLTDRTRLQMQERTIRAQVAGLDLALSQASVAVVVTDGGARVVRWSPGAEQQFGVTDDQAEGVALAELLDLDAEILQPLVQGAATGEVIRGSTLRRRSGSEINVSVALAATDEFGGRRQEGFDAARLAWLLLPADNAPFGASLRASERRLRKILQHINDTITIIDEEGRTLSSSGQFSNEPILGFEAEAWASGLNMFDLIHPDDQGRVGQAMVDLLEHPGSRTSGLIKVRTADGRYIDAEGWAVNLLHDPDVAGILVTTRNVSERVRNEAFVSNQAEVLRQIAASAPLEMTMRRLADLVNTQVHGGTTALVQLVADAEEVRTFSTLPFPTPSVPALLRTVVPTGSTAVVSVADVDELGKVPGLPAALRAAGRHAVVAVPVVAAGAGSNGTQPVRLGAVLCLFDTPRSPTTRELDVLTSAGDLAAIAIERELTERHLAHRALHDQLTGLANRHLLMDRLEQALNRAKRRGRSLALMFLDLDRFKTVNDSLGHETGDGLLRQVAERLRLLVRPEDTVARFGGDEFVVLVEHVIDEQDAAQIADRLESAMSEPFEVGGHSLVVTASVGIVIGKGDDQPAAMLRNADSAMYRAKELGRNRTEIFDSKLEAHLAERSQLSLDVRAALSEGHLRLVYQPMVEVSSGHVPLIEAQLRWEHPVHGRLLPMDFLGVAEDSGQGLELGAWMFERGLRDLADFARDPAWVHAPSWPRPPRLSVKLSGRQLAHPELTTRVEQALRRHHLSTGNLAIEVAERFLTSAGEMALRNLEALHQRGVQVILDDVGGAQGSSLLGILHRIHVDVLKVSAAVTAAVGIPRGDDGPAPQPQHSMAAGLVGLGHGLGMAVVAQAVDTTTQLEQLRTLGYDMVQGESIAAPVEAAELVDLLPAPPSRPRS